MQTCQLSYSWPHMHSYYQHVKRVEGSLPYVSYAHAFFEYLDRAIMIVSKKFQHSRLGAKGPLLVGEEVCKRVGK